jgi:hypothetical protein
MLNDNDKQKLVDKVSIEIATICKFYNVDFYELEKNQQQMIIEVFQFGVGFIEKMKKDEIEAKIVSLRLPKTNEKAKDDIIDLENIPF